jgi:hypothetical protein
MTTRYLDTGTAMIPKQLMNKISQAAYKTRATAGN